MAHGMEGPLILCDGGDNPVSDASIVFVHGLRGNSIETWTSGDVCWPRDLLGPDLENVRIITWGYDSSVAKLSDYSSQNSIFSHSENLLSDLGSRRYKQPHRPIIFIGHSLGGLVIKEALIRSSIYLHNEQDLELGAIYSSTVGVIFLGTPHRGSDKAGFAQIVASVAKLALRKPNEKLLQNLERESDVLEHQRRSFASISEKMSLRCLFEEKPTGIGVIVPESSACIDGFRVKTNSIPANHMEICKFKSEDDLGYQRTFWHVHSLLKEARKEDNFGAQADSSKSLKPTRVLSPAPSGAFQSEQSNGRNELHYAAIHGDKFGVGRLLDLNETKVDAIDYDGMTALHHAMANGRDNLILPLLRRGADVNVFDDQGMTPLMHAAVAGSTESIVLLLKKGANALAEDKNGHTPNYHGFRSGHESALHLLDEISDDIGSGLQTPSRFGTGALEFAIETRQLTVVEYLLSKEIPNYKRPHHRSEKLLNVETATKMLLQDEISIGDHPYFTGGKGTIIHYAVWENKSYTISLAKLMLESGMNLNSPLKNNPGIGPTILHFAVASANLALAQFLVDQRVNLNNHYGPKKRTALYDAVEKGHQGLTKLLLDAGASSEVKDLHGNTPFHIAVKKGNESMIKFLLDRGSDIEAKDLDGDTPLHIAARERSESTTILLLDRGADVDAKNSEEKTPLHIAVREERKRVTNLLLNRRANIEARDWKGNTPLHLAAQQESMRIAEVLISTEANVEAKNSNEDTPLHIVAREANIYMLPQFRQWGANFEAKNLDDDTLLHLAVRSGHIATARSLINIGEDDNKEKEMLRNRLLLLAVSDDKVFMVEMLIKEGANPDSEGALGECALHIAAKKGNLEITLMLLREGATVAAIDSNNRTAIYYASNLGHSDIERALNAADLD